MSRHDLFLRISQNLKDEESRALRTYVGGKKLLPAGEIEHMNPQEIFVKLEQKMKLPRGDLSLLVDLMTKIGRDDFAKEAETVAAQEMEGTSLGKRLWRPMTSPPSSPEQKMMRTSAERPSDMVMAVTSCTSDSPTEFSQEHPQNPILLARMKQDIGNEDLSLEYRVKILKLKMELKERELDYVNKNKKREVKSLKNDKTFLSQQSLETKYKEIQAKFEHERAIVKRVYKDCLIFFLDFETKSNFEHFWGSYTSGRLSDSLSRVLTADEMQRLQHGDQLVHVVRTVVLMEDYRAWRDFFRKGLDHATSADNLLTLPSSARLVDRSRLRGLDLAVASTDRTDDVPALNFTVRQVQVAMQTSKEKLVRRLESEHREQMRTAKEQTEAMVRSQTKEITRLKEKEEKAQKILLEQKEENQKLSEANKSLEARIEELLTAKQPVASRSQQKDSAQTMSDQHSKATNTGQVKQSEVRGFSSTGVERPWVQKVSFGGRGSARGKFVHPLGVAVSQDNEVYVTDWDNSRIQVFTMDGVYIRGFDTTMLPRDTGRKLKPWDVFVDRNDNLWVVSEKHVVQYSREGTCLATLDLPHVGYLHGITVATHTATEQVIVTEYDGQNGRLRVFNQDGSKVGMYGSGHRSPKPWCPQSVTVDGEGNILVTEYRNHCVHVLDREGNLKFKFGSWGFDESQFKCPQGICVDGKGNVIVADYGNGCVKMFDSQGRFLCYIASGMKGPQAVTVSPGGDVVVTDQNHTVSVWTQGPRIQKLLTAASTGVDRPWVKKVSFGGRGSARGKFSYPRGVAVLKDNKVYIADRGNSRIQVFTIDGVYIREFTTTLPGETGEKLEPKDVAVDRNDNLWVVSEKHVVQYSREGTCLATIDLPHVGYHHGITVSMATEQVIVTEYDLRNGRLRVFNQDGSEVGTYGSGHRSPKSWWPGYVTVDGEGNILVTDSNNHCVHVLGRRGNFKFRFGSEGSDKSQLKNPQGICVDGKGDIIVADDGNHRVKMFDSQGRFLCYIASGMKGPMAVTVSPGGDVVVTDFITDIVSIWTQG